MQFSHLLVSIIALGTVATAIPIKVETVINSNLLPRASTQTSPTKVQNCGKIDRNSFNACCGVGEEPAGNSTPGFTHSKPQQYVNTPQYQDKDTNALAYQPIKPSAQALLSCAAASNTSALGNLASIVAVPGLFFDICTET
ncbi:hypothetical protein HYFRA_00010145 [Hymenoscyphus fraxineus]|uniref:Hydrophobin n=1 Tax=Hymenoscyphus fraxineus TaxID=746836 RepID=A0A9N9KXP6_9HELO|nr:hypothetical protein HYFRA_00010145 [Hymenoscyphus fraxineus]